MRTLYISPDEWEGEPTSLTGYNYDNGYLETWLDMQEMTIEQMTDKHWPQYVAYRNRDSHSFQFKAQRHGLSSIRAYLERQGMAEHPLWKVPWPKGSRNPQRTLKVWQRDAILAACGEKRPVMRARDRALTWLLWDTSIRKFEVAGALLDHLDIDPRVRTLELLTKANDLQGRHFEKKKFWGDCLEAMTEWLAIRGELANPTCRNIFVSQTGNALTPDGVGCIFKRLSKVLGWPVSCHDFRRGGGTYRAERVSGRLNMVQMGIINPGTYRDYTVDVDLNALDNTFWINGNESR